MSVSIDHGGIPSLDNINIKNHTAVSKVITQWIGVMDNAGDAAEALPRILEEIEKYKVWDLCCYNDPRHALQCTGIESAVKKMSNVSIDEMVEKYLQQVGNGEPVMGTLEALQGELSPTAYTSQVRNPKIIEMSGQGKTQQAIADEVGLSQQRVGQVIQVKSSILQKTSTQADEAQKAKRHRITQNHIEAIRKVDQELAARADRGDIPINTARRQAGLIDQARLTINSLKKCSDDEVAIVERWIGEYWATKQH